MMNSLPALHIGSRALALLGTADARWDVLATVGHAVYIVNRDGEIVWITDRAEALHARGVLLAALPTRLTNSRLPLRASAGRLHCAGVKLTWRQVDLWEPRAAVTSDSRVEGFPDRVCDAIRSVGSMEGPPAGVRRDEALPEGDGSPGGEASVADALTEKLMRGVRTLSVAPAGSEVLPRLRAVAYVVGLGQGLTPAGDDMLGAFLYTLQMLSGTCYAMPGIDWADVRAWVHRVARRTSVISRCMLLDHAYGSTCAPLAEFLRAALEGGEDAQLSRLARGVAGVGASSGRSLLAGVGAACSAMLTCRAGPNPVPVGRVDVVLGEDQRREVACPLTSSGRSNRQTANSCVG
ncbi:MAG: DUF2877 domain-containing protein [Candidatus Bipolaricaulota bacterium]